jgi:hypothetical protein
VILEQWDVMCDGSSRALACSTAALALALLTVACGSRPPAIPGTLPSVSLPQVAILGPSRLSATQLTAWFNGREPRPTGTYAASVPVESLVQIYLDEGRVEGITGDVAFMQSVVETGWFRFPGLVPASANNFAGIGATDASPSHATFPDARTGIRAQIQHLRAYADPLALTCTMPPLTMPCVDPRFHLVLPKGKAPTWNLLGSGNWASAPGYGTSIVTLFQEALRLGTSANE